MQIKIYFLLYVVSFFKRLAYTLTASCNGSKSVTQPDASSKRYLLDKISCETIVLKTTRTDINSRTLHVFARFSQFKVNKKPQCFWIMKSAFVWIIYTCTLYFEFHIHAISYPLILLCKVSIVETIKYQNKDAYRFAVLTVLWFLNKGRGSSWTFASPAGDRGSIPGQNKPESLKQV